MTVLIMILLVLLQTISSSTSLWTRTTGKVQAFQGARAAFDSLTRNLSQATLQSYGGYADRQGNPIPLINPSFKPVSGTIDRNKVPSRYLRFSELHFLAGPTTDIFAQCGMVGLTGGAKTPGQAIFFQAPVGFSKEMPFQPSLLNNCGYYVQFERDDDSGGKGTGAIPSFANPPPSTCSRYLLMEVLQPAESNGIYESSNRIDANGLPVVDYDTTWLRDLDLETRKNRHVLAENIPLLVMLPKLAPEDEKAVDARYHLGQSNPGDGSLIAPNYAYDSRSWINGYQGAAVKRADNEPLVENILMNRLPPMIQVLMVAIDEHSAIRLIGDASSPPANLQAALFGNGDRFTSASDYPADRKALEDDLDQLHINYRIFETEVRLPNAAIGE